MDKNKSISVSPLGTKLFFLKILPKILYCLQSTNMATLSRSCKLRTMYVHVHVQYFLNTNLM